MSTKIWPSARISKEILKKIRETGKKPEQNLYIKAIASVLYIKSKFKSSVLFGNSNSEIAEKLGLSRHAFDRLRKKLIPLGYMWEIGESDSRYPKGYKVAYAVKRVRDIGERHKDRRSTNLIIEIEKNDNIKDIAAKIFEVSLSYFFASKETIVNRITTQAVSIVSKRKRNGRWLKVPGIKNPTEAFLKRLDNLCEEVIWMDEEKCKQQIEAGQEKAKGYSKDELRQILDSGIRKIFMQRTVANIRSCQNISNYRYYKFRKKNLYSTYWFEEDCIPFSEVVTPYELRDVQAEMRKKGQYIYWDGELGMAVVKKPNIYHSEKEMSSICKFYRGNGNNRRKKGCAKFEKAVYPNSYSDYQKEGTPSPSCAASPSLNHNLTDLPY